LVVEDEAPIRDIAERMLKRNGYRVLTAPDGEAAMDLFRAHASEISAVLLDLTSSDSWKIVL
jgi:DNA-binding response OmpR family regulator